MLFSGSHPGLREVFLMILVTNDKHKERSELPVSEQ